MLGTIVFSHLAITIVHGTAHGLAAVPMSAAANLYIALVIVVGPLAGLWLARTRPIAGAWLVAATMSGALVFGLLNHFVFASVDNVRHVAAEWRPLFAGSALLLALTEIAGAFAGGMAATRRSESSS